MIFSLLIKFLIILILVSLEKKLSISSKNYHLIKNEDEIDGWLKEAEESGEIAIDTEKKVITSTVHKTKKDALFSKNLKETKQQIKSLQKRYTSTYQNKHTYVPIFV